ncbi:MULTISPECIES: universal stress protein [Streptomyces]|uniref:universal stress protein n=1 Tax=Streptomyces TaxID=1883 RepID=UPI001EF05BA9|nr:MULTISPECIES: universal stress protein [unclassified Streptomyces]
MDGSAQSLAAAEWAAREAALRERALHPVHAWNRQPRSSEGEGEHAVQRYPCRRVLRQAEDRIRAGYPTVRLTCEQAEGRPPRFHGVSGRVRRPGRGREGHPPPSSSYGAGEQAADEHPRRGADGGSFGPHRPPGRGAGSRPRRSVRRGDRVRVRGGSTAWWTRCFRARGPSGTDIRGARGTRRRPHRTAPDTRPGPAPSRTWSAVAVPRCRLTAPGTRPGAPQTCCGTTATGHAQWCVCR